MRRTQFTRKRQSMTRSPTRRAWVAEGRADRLGRQVRHGGKPALLIFAVSVHQSFSTRLEDRLSLMTRVATALARRVPAGVPSLWVFPGGFFGFNADAGQLSWRYLSPKTQVFLEHKILDRARLFPAPSLIAVGVDSRSARSSQDDPTQQVWVIRRLPYKLELSRVTRGLSPLEGRKFRVGRANVAFFVCGEFTGSRTEENGAFCTSGSGHEQFLIDPARQLRDCDVLVDLAHVNVAGSISGHASPRMVHRRQMERFSRRQGVSVLAHHHSGRLVNGRPHFKHQSNWIAFRGNKWLGPSHVVEVVE
jgi:hypothetical protein